VSDLVRIFTRVSERLAAGESLLLLTDYDGTLTPIVPDPMAAWLPRGVWDDLRILAGSRRTRVGIVSGRALEDLRARVRIPEVIYAGCHGLEIEGPRVSFTHPAAQAERPALAALAGELSLRTAAVPGVVVEPKGLTVAVHYRNATWEGALRLAKELQPVLAEGRFRVLPGKKVVELLPQVGWSKGEGALRIVDHVRAHTGSHLLTTYLGDDSTDEMAFAVLHGQALTVRVGWWVDSAATYWLRGPAEVRRLLSALAAEVGDRDRG
jgi:trehalose-phosphatase